MGALKVAITILTILCCSFSVHSIRTSTSKKSFQFGKSEVIIGKNNVNKKALIYALCKSKSNNRKATCSVNYNGDVFDDNSPKQTCNFKLKTEMVNGKLDILEVNFWGEDKAFFVWREINQTNILDTFVTINAVHIENCAFNVVKLKVDNRPDSQPQVFIIPSENSYSVTFMDQDRCRNQFCKVIVAADNTVSQALPWFPNTGLISDLVATNEPSKKLMISHGEIFPSVGTLKIYLLDENEWQVLGSFTDLGKLGWSTSNRVISFCLFGYCVMHNHRGGSRRSRSYNIRGFPATYEALFNLPNDEHVALVCPIEDQGNYRITKIRNDEDLFFDEDVEDLHCSRKPKHITAQFFRIYRQEYCLSVFYSANERDGTYNFNTYCFLILP